MSNVIEIRYQVGEAWKGTYDPAHEYANANVVQDPVGLSVYRSLRSGNVGHALTDQSWWFRIIDMSDIHEESVSIRELNDSMAESEALRVSAEQGRVNAENSRASAETSRQEAEQGRVVGESGRATAEAARASAEVSRASSEASRQQAEASRATAETSRATAETLRDQSESSRAVAENSRTAAEAARVTAENSRENAEAVREAGEQSRNVSYAAAEGDSSSDAGDGSRWGAFRSAEAARDAEIAAKLDSINNLAAAVNELNETKANPDGYYEQMTVGTAMNLAGSGDVDAEFAFRSSGGSADIGTGAATVTKILGDTFTWNQCANNPEKYGTYTGIRVTFDGLLCTITVSQEYDSSSALSVARYSNNIIEGNKFYLRIFSDSDYVGYRDNSVGDKFVDSIITKTPNNNSGYVRLKKNIPPGTYHIAFNFIDLTRLFGPGNLPTSVNQVKEFLTNKIGYKDYYPYSSSVWKHNKALGIKSVGRNLYDPATGKAELPALTGTPDLTNGVNCFQIIGTYTGITDEDGNAITPNEDGYFTVAHPMTITVAGGNADDTCVALTWSGVRNGEYEPHREDTMYFVDADHDLSEVTSGGVQVFPEGLRSVYDARDSIEGNRATVAIAKTNVTGNAGDTIVLDGCDPNATEYRCSRNIGTLSGGVLTLSESASNKSVYYPLATPQTYVLDQPVTTQYVVDDFGTEKRLTKDPDSVQAPLLIRVQYAMNAADTIRRLPVNYISKGSMDNLCAELADKLGAHLGVAITITSEFDAVEQEYNYSVTIDANATPEPEVEP